MSHSHAAHLPLTSQPPHDPRSLPFNARSGWPIAQADNIEVDSCGNLSLCLQADSLRSLTENNGSLGGLQLPKYLAYLPNFGLMLLDRLHHRLKKFDPCECRFIDMPCSGGMGNGIRQLNQPEAITICGDNLLVADTANHRLVVYSLLGFLVRGIWTPPDDVLEYPWQPVDVRMSMDRKVLVADVANTCVHIFNLGGKWLRSIDIAGAVSSIGIDQQNHLYVVTDMLSPLQVYDLSSEPSGEKLLDVSQLNEIADHFCQTDFHINAQGQFDLGAYCDLYNNGQVKTSYSVWFDATGQKVKDVVNIEKHYFTEGSLYSSALDSRLYRCQWDRIALQSQVPAGTRIRISSFSAETELTDVQIKALNENEWLTRQWMYPEKTDQVDWDCLIRSAPGRYLWLKIDMLGDGLASPAICHMQLDFPRISLARYLPGVFSAEPQSADFTDRFLSVFDRGFRQIEQTLDTMGALFDPLSAPAESGKKDFLSWLASWIGVTLDRQLPLETRRRLVKNAAGLYRCRGTHKGLRQMIDLYLGFNSRSCAIREDCRPCKVKLQAEDKNTWQAPQLILEHFVLRRWLFVGCSRLGEQAQLWGQKIINRSQLSGGQFQGNAQLGVTELNTRQDPLRDPFHLYAHKFSIFLPAWVGRLESYRKSIDRLINAEKPAHTQAQINYVEPRFRIGIQSMIGFDSVIACYPRGVTLADENQQGSLLGKATVLSEQDHKNSGIRIGEKSTIGSSTLLS